MRAFLVLKGKTTQGSLPSYELMGGQFNYLYVPEQQNVAGPDGQGSPRATGETNKFAEAL
jgi:hypothetical protein